MLSATGLYVSYGSVPALRDVDLSIGEGRTLAVVGANGAGKSTLGLTIAGALAPDAGAIMFDGVDIAGRSPEHIAWLGVSLVPEARHIFEGLTVAENLALGMTAARSKAEARDRLDDLYERFPILAERRNGLGTHLSGGEQQQLAIARALLSGPRLLILDEPSLGLSPVMVDAVYETLAEIKERGMTILLVEQSPVRAGAIADEVMVLAGGSVRRYGPASDVLGAGADLDAAYFGEAKS